MVVDSMLSRFSLNAHVVLQTSAMRCFSSKARPDSMERFRHGDDKNAMKMKRVVSYWQGAESHSCHPTRRTAMHRAENLASPIVAKVYTAALEGSLQPVRPPPTPPVTSNKMIVCIDDYIELRRLKTHTFGA